MYRTTQKLVGVLLTLLAVTLPVAALATDGVTFVVTKQQMENARTFAQHLRSQGDLQLADVVLAASNAMQRNDAAGYNEAYQTLKSMHESMTSSALAEAESFARSLPYTPSSSQATESDCDAYCVFGTCSVRNCNGTATCGCSLLFFPSCSCVGGGQVVTRYVPALSPGALVVASLLLVIPGFVLLRRRMAS